MAQSTIRFAAGAGVVAASLLIVGPYPAQAFADTNGSGSHSRNDEWVNGSNQSSGQKRTGPDLANSDLNIGDAGGDSKSSVDPPLMDLGTGGSDREDLAVANSIAPDGPATLRSAAVAEKPTSVNASGAAPRSGSDHTGAPTVSVGSPRVVVGNGRSPGLQAGEPVRENPVTPENVPPAVPVAIEVTIAPLPPPLPPVERIQPPRLVVGELGTAKVDTTTDPLFGLAGLILIPAVGAALGYRQARAAQALRGSGRT